MGSFPIRLKLHQEIMELYIYIHVCHMPLKLDQYFWWGILKNWSFWDELSVWSDLLLPSIPLTSRPVSIQFNISQTRVFLLVLCNAEDRNLRQQCDVVCCTAYQLAYQCCTPSQRGHPPDLPLPTLACPTGGIRWEPLGTW